MATSDNRFALASAQEQAEATLAHAFGEGLLNEDELDQRLERLTHSTQLSQVEALVHDLEPAPKGAAMVPTTPTSAALVPRGDLEPSHRSYAIMSEHKRTGEWSPAQRNELVVVMGSATLDMRDAHLPAGETLVHVRGLLSETTLIVPPGMLVTTECSTIMAEVSQDDRVSEAPRHPASIRVIGTLVMSELQVRERRVGETKRDARKRRRRERRALRRGARKQRALRRGD